MYVRTYLEETKYKKYVCNNNADFLLLFITPLSDAPGKTILEGFEPAVDIDHYGWGLCIPTAAFAENCWFNRSRRRKKLKIGQLNWRKGQSQGCR
jgi:hypothetical protein